MLRSLAVDHLTSSFFPIAAGERGYRTSTVEPHLPVMIDGPGGARISDPALKAGALQEQAAPFQVRSSGSRQMYLLEWSMSPFLP